jgi:glutaminase
MDLARELALHMFNPSAVPPPALRRSYNATQVNSRRRLSTKAFHTLRRYGERIRVMELQGPLLFSTFEPVIRELVKQAPYCQHVILNFSYVSSIDDVCLRMLRDVSRQLTSGGVKLVCCHTARIAKSIASVGLDEDAIFPSEDAALESCENAVLAIVMKDHVLELPPVPLASCALFSQCDDAELKLLDEQMASKEFTSGETIIQTGTIADELFMLTSGSVEVRLHLEGKRYQRLDVFAAGMSFGELAFLDGSPRSADIVALGPVSCRRVINRQLFDVLGERHPALKAKILNELALQLSARLRQANIEISALRG